METAVSCGNAQAFSEGKCTGFGAIGIGFIPHAAATGWVQGISNYE